MAADLNTCTLIGNLTRDAEVSYLKSGSAVAKMSIASNRSVKRGDNWENEVSYFDVSLFGKSAENLKQYLTKGKKIGVSGSLRQDRWEKGGQKFSKVYVVADDIQLLGGQGEGGSKSHSAPQQTSSNDNFNGDFQEDIPF